jgi:hypothetical protein
MHVLLRGSVHIASPGGEPKSTEQRSYSSKQDATEICVGILAQCSGPGKAIERLIFSGGAVM